MVMVGLILGFGRGVDHPGYLMSGVEELKGMLEGGSWTAGDVQRLICRLVAI